MNLFSENKTKRLVWISDQENQTYELGYTLTLKRNNNNDAIFPTAAVDAAKVVVKDIS